MFMINKQALKVLKYFEEQDNQVSYKKFKEDRGSASFEILDYLVDNKLVDRSNLICDLNKQPYPGRDNVEYQCILDNESYRISQYGLSYLTESRYKNLEFWLPTVISAVSFVISSLVALLK